MSATVDRVAAWSNTGDFSSLDLGVFRLIFASTMLVLLPNYFWISNLDPAFYRPAPGPFTLISTFPPSWLLATLDVVVAMTLALLLVGYKTRPVSYLLSGSLLVGDGFAYSFGKIDHSILLVLTPLLLGIAGWGNCLSLDSRNRRSDEQPVNYWAMRAFAVAIGVAFVTAGISKATGGWLNLSNQATYAYVVQRNERGRADWLAPFASQMHFPFGWEVLDWTTVLLELGLIFCALNWRAWRLGLCAATSFHVGVMLALNIDFWMNMVAYGAFVLWSQSPDTLWRTGLSRARARASRAIGSPAALLIALALAAASFVVAHVYGPLAESLGWIPVLAGLVIATLHLNRLVELAVVSSKASSSRRGAGHT